MYRFLISSGVADSSMSRISYGLQISLSSLLENTQTSLLELERLQYTLDLDFSLQRIRLAAKQLVYFRIVALLDELIVYYQQRMGGHIIWERRGFR